MNDSEIENKISKLRELIDYDEEIFAECREYIRSSYWSIDDMIEYVSCSGGIPPDEAKFEPVLFLSLGIHGFIELCKTKSKQE